MKEEREEDRPEAGGRRLARRKTKNIRRLRGKQPEAFVAEEDNKRAGRDDETLRQSGGGRFSGRPPGPWAARVAIRRAGWAWSRDGPEKMRFQAPSSQGGHEAEVSK